MIVRLNTGKEFIITSGYGSIDSAHPTAHKGIDLAMPIGTDIISPVKGIVSRVVDYGNQNVGKGVMVKFENGKELIFGHLSKINVKKGQIVDIGSKLGESGNTGNSTGPHLHLGLKDIDGTFADPSLYERLFQKVYALQDKGLLEAVPHKIHLADAMNQVVYLTPEQLALLDQIQNTAQQFFQ